VKLSVLFAGEQFGLHEQRQKSVLSYFFCCIVEIPW